MKTAKEVQDEHNKFVAAVRTLFTTATGKELMEFMDRYMVRGKLFSEDPYETAYNIGRRDLVLELRSMVDGDMP